VAALATYSPVGREAIMDLKAFGARLKAVRQQAGLTQKQLAERAGLSQKAISHWEVGEREPGMLAAAALAKALELTVEDLLQEPMPEAEKPKRGRPPKAKVDRPPQKPKGKGRGKQ
jgi:putative transcriptional regulator